MNGQETEDDTYAAELKGWHGIYYIEDYDFDPCGFFLRPEDAVQVLQGHGWFEETDTDCKVTKTVRRRFERLSSREKQWLRDKTVGRFLNKVIEPIPEPPPQIGSPEVQPLIPKTEAAAVPAQKKMLSEDEWKQCVESGLTNWTSFTSSYPSGMG